MQHLLHLTQLTCEQIKIDSWTYAGNQYMSFNFGGGRARGVDYIWFGWNVVHVFHYIATRGATIDSYSVLVIII